MLNAAPRFGIAFAVAAGVTFGVALMMQGLISSGGSVLQDDNIGKLVEFVHVQQDDEIRTKDRQPKKPPTPPKEPPKPEMAKPDFDRSANAMDMGGLNLGADLTVDAGLSGSGGDGEYLPIVKVAPQYPRRAAMKGIEGYVVVEYTVSKLGTVVDPVVVEADPPNIFNRAAIRSATKYKYKPKVENGKAIEVPGVRTIIRFELEDNGKRR